MRKKQTGKDLIEARLVSGQISEQKSWKFIWELNSYSEERLNALALTGGKRDYTYRQMFRQWERYAEVFSALEITDRNHSRVGMVSTAAVEPILAFYGLNMTGASVSMVHILNLLDADRWEKLIQKEGITDVILCDQQLQQDVLKRVLQSKDKLGLRNVIVLHNTVGGSTAPQGMELLSNLNYQMLRNCSGALFMDQLLRKYEAAPIVYADGQSIDDALIIHTSGTTSGIHKPVPLSDRGLNEAVARILREERFTELRGKLVSCLAMDLAGSYGVVDMMHLTFAFSGTLVTPPLGAFNPRFAQAIKEYGVNVLFASNVMLNEWMKSPATLDLSSLSVVFLGGAYTSVESKKRYNEFLQKCGAKTRVSNGYGLSEVGGACILADSDRDDDAIGYPLPGVKVKIFEEDEEKYYDLEDGPRTGVLFLSTPSTSCGRIDSEVFFELDEIDGEEYLNTYDLVTVNEDGSMTCIGRMNKFFVNNEGVRFNAGLVEGALAAQPGIEACGLAPEYDKMIHDTIPILYVQTNGNQASALPTVRQALFNVFIRDNKISETNLPGQCVLTNQIPYTATGKVDVYSILKGETQGTRYKITPIRKQGKLLDIRLDPAHFERLGMWAGLPEELDGDVEMVNRMLGIAGGPQGGAGQSQQASAPGMDMGQILNLLQSFLSGNTQNNDQNTNSQSQPQTNDMYKEASRMMMQFLQNMCQQNQKMPFSQPRFAGFQQNAQMPFSQPRFMGFRQNPQMPFGQPQCRGFQQNPFMNQMNMFSQQTQSTQQQNADGQAEQNQTNQAPQGMGCQIPGMQQQNAGGQGTPFQMPFMPQGMGCQMPGMQQQNAGGQGTPFQMPFMPQGMGCQMPGMPQQNADGQGTPFQMPFMPQGMGCQMPGMPQQNADGQEAQNQTNQAPQGMGCQIPGMPQQNAGGQGTPFQMPFMPQQNAGCQAAPFAQPRFMGFQRNFQMPFAQTPCTGLQQMLLLNQLSMFLQQMQSMQQQNAGGQGTPYQMPFMPQGMGCQMPGMPQQNSDGQEAQNQANQMPQGMGCQMPGMPQQNAGGQGTPYQMPFMPQGMGCQMPGTPQQNAGGQGTPNQEQQNTGGQGTPYQMPFMPQGMGCQPNFKGSGAQQMPNMEQIFDLLSKLFNASTYSSFYEE